MESTEGACLFCICCSFIPSYNVAFHLDFLTLFCLLYDNLYFQGADGILVPGGFGDRGVQGKILAAKYARENNIPYLGICLGMQIAVIEFARSVLNLQDANSTEFDPDTTNPCVIFMPEVDKDAILFIIIFR